VIAKLDSKNFNVQLSACRVIIQIGHPARKAGPRLVNLLEEGIASSRSWASIALGAIGPHEDYDVVDLLSQRLSRFYLVDRQRALVGLAYLGPEAKAALPAVEKLMNDPTKSVQATSARTRWKITGETEKSVEILIPLLPTMEHGVEAMDVLAEMESAAKTAVPALIQQTRSPEAPSRESAVYTLAAIGAAARSAIPDLEKVAAKDNDRLIREAAKFAIQSISVADAKASEEAKKLDDGKTKGPNSDEKEPPKSGKDGLHQCRHTAVDTDRLAGNPTGFVRHQEFCGCRQIG
jgi:HEAT repeat protein